MNNKKIALLAVLALCMAAAPAFAEQASGSSAAEASEESTANATQTVGIDLGDVQINEALDNTARQLEEYAAAHDLLLPEDQSAELLVLYAVKTTYKEIPGERGEPSSRPMFVDLDLVSRFSGPTGGEPDINLVYLSLADNAEQDVVQGERGGPSYSPSGLYLGELRRALESATDDPVAWINAKIRSLVKQK